VSFCDLCQIVLCAGTPERNTAQVHVHDGRKFIFCSDPCRWIFEKEPERYAQHKDVVKRVLAGEAPANVVALIQRYFGLDYGSWGKDVYGGRYPWLHRPKKGEERKGMDS
jgi:toluene monooxygenase system protein A